MEESDLRRELERCHRPAYSWALHCCRWDPADAEDVLQTAYLKVLDGRARFDGRSSFRTWLFSVVRQTALDGRRRAALRWRRSAPLDVDVQAPAVPDASEENAELVGALQQLSDRQRDVLLLVFYHEHTVEEASAVLGISVGSARTHYARGKERLRAMLMEEHHDDR